MVIAFQSLLKLINVRKNKMLLIAESSMSASQFRAFRKLFLLEFGENGLEGELQNIHIEQRKQDGNGRE